MKYRATFIIGAAVGYLLGTRAGRERYEQIKRVARRCAENPTVQETAGLLREQAADLAGTTKEKVGATLHGRLGDRIPGLRHAEDATDAETEAEAEAEDVTPPRSTTRSTPLHH